MKLSLKVKTLNGGQLRRLREKAPHLIVHAQNRAATSAVAVLSRGVAADMGMKVSVVKAAVRIEPASQQQMVTRVYADAKRIPLINFGARGPYPSRGRGRGVRAKTPTGRYPNAFIAVVGKGGHRGVFVVRGGKGRSRKGMPASSPELPIVELRGPSIAHVFRKHVPASVTRYYESLDKNLQHNFRYFTTQGASSQES